MVVRAIYEQGIFRPLDPIPHLTERSEVTLTIGRRASETKTNRKPVDRAVLHSLRGSWSQKDAALMQRLITEGRRVEGEW
jgi:predicted DNA-binding antitoxin AbrB/MazE fold protein